MRFTCDKTPVFASTCVIGLNGQEIDTASIQIDGTSFAFTPDLSLLTVGSEVPLTFTGCAISAQATIAIASGMFVCPWRVELPTPALVSVEPSFRIFAGESYTYKLVFDEPITLVESEAVEVEDAGETVLVAVTAVSPTTLQFSYTLTAEGTAVFTLKKDAVKDDLERALPEDVVFTRSVGMACGPAHLAALSADAEVCRCRRSNDQCECHCDSMGASMNY